MANRAGLRKVTKSVRGKHGSVRRSYWVKATGAVKGAAKAAGGFVSKHKGKIAGAAALAGAAYLGVKHGSKIAGVVQGIRAAHRFSNAKSDITGKRVGISERAKHAAVGAVGGAYGGARADQARMHKLGAASERIGRDVANSARGAAQSVANAGKRVADRARTGVRHAAGRAAFLAGR